MGDLICTDLTVVEIADGKVAASEVGMFLADNGARVLKIEPPEGDGVRASRPAGWLVWNRGKESVVADFADASSVKAVRDLIARADVVIESLPAGEADRLGLGYDALAEANPGLVYCCISAYGPCGAYANVPAYDALVMARNGSFVRGDFGFRDGPIYSGALMASNGAAHQAISGIMAALIVRDATGVGQRVDATLYSGLNPNDYYFSYHLQLMAKTADTPHAAAPSSSAPSRVPAASRYGAFACTRDGRWIAFSPQQAHQARALIDVLELNSLYDDPRFADMPAFWTLEDAAAWDAAVHDRVKERDADEWVARALKNDDLPFEVVLSAEEALDHPQIRANGNVATVDDPVHGPIDQIGPVAIFRDTPSRIERSAPALDQHGDLDLPAPSVERTAAGALPTHALAGKTIVELGFYYAMPYGVTMAAALGARVIKVEALDGDPMRWSFGPYEWGSAKTTEGKESICLDARSDAGREILHEIIKRADVVIHGFRPGVEQRLGADYATVQKLNPRAVFIHGAGYGSVGPYAHRPIYAGTAVAAAGSIHRQAAHWLDTELNASLDATESQIVVAPRLRGLTDGDANAALAVLSAICLGLRHQARTGQGQYIATSMIGSNALAYADDFNRYAGKIPVRQADPEQYGSHALERIYETSDGWVCLVIDTPAEWQAFISTLTALGVTRARELAVDARFATAASRADNDDALIDELTAIFAGRAASDWETSMLAAGVGCVAVNDVPQAADMAGDPVLRDMGLVAPIEHPLFGSLLRYAPPAHFSKTPGRVAPGCTIAQHTASILAELGYDDAAISELVAAKVVRVAE